MSVKSQSRLNVLQIRIKEEDIETAVKMIEASKKPYVFVGGGAIASGCRLHELDEFVQKIDAPVADTLMGKGAFDGTDPFVYRYAWYAWNKGIKLWSKPV